MKTGNKRATISQLPQLPQTKKTSDPKKKLLLASVLAALTATGFALYGTWTTNANIDELRLISNIKLFTSAGYLGLLSVALFFVGTVYPKD